MATPTGGSWPFTLIGTEAPAGISIAHCCRSRLDGRCALCSGCSVEVPQRRQATQTGLPTHCTADIRERVAQSQNDPQLRRCSFSKCNSAAMVANPQATYV